MQYHFVKPSLYALTFCNRVIRQALCNYFLFATSYSFSWPAILLQLLDCKYTDIVILAAIVIQLKTFAEAKVGSKKLLHSFKYWFNLETSS